jgi:dTDP-4-dehydrorhamnose reductase
MKILVTGSNGLLGQTLSELILSTSRATLVATSKGENRYPHKGDYTYFDLDVCDLARLSDVISITKPDVIINTAAMTNVDTCHVQRDACWKLNVDAVNHLVNLCETHTIHLIHLSTDFVFDGNKGPYTEADQPAPVSFYGESKLEAEKIVQQSTCKWTILRTILVYGVTANMSRSNIVLWVKGALEKGESIRVVNDQWRMPTLASDLAEACLLAAQKKAPGLFHISGEEYMTIYEIACKVARFWNLDATLVHPVSSRTLNQEAKRPLKTGFLLAKAKRELGYQPHSFLNGLKIIDEQLSAINN